MPRKDRNDSTNRGKPSRPPNTHCIRGHDLSTSRYEGRYTCRLCTKELRVQKRIAKGLKIQSTMFERGICTFGHALNDNTIRKSKHHYGQCAICHRLRSKKMRSQEIKDYAGVISSDPCSYCGNPSNSFDHIVPRYDGGALEDPDNLTAACLSCNSKKRTKGLLIFMLNQVNKIDIITSLSKET